MGLRELSDDELLIRTPRDARAFGVFYERHATAVLAFLMKATRDPERALDLTSEVFAAALGASRRYRPREAPARAWLFGIARNKLWEGQRRRAAEFRARQRLAIPRLEFEDEALERVERVYDAARVDLVAIATERLPESERAAVFGRFVDERDYAQLAADGDCSEDAVRKRASRGLRKLASWLREEGAR